MGYENLYYSPKDEKFARDAEAYIAKGYDLIDKSKMVPGFTMSLRTRPLTIAKLDAYIKEQSLQIQSRRTLDELRTFVWKNGRPEAQTGYNDDLIISIATACYVRDTALKFAQQGVDLTRAMLNSTTKTSYNPFFSSTQINDPKNSYKMKVGGKDEDLSWLLD